MKQKLKGIQVSIYHITPPAASFSLAHTHNQAPQQQKTRQKKSFYRPDNIDIYRL